MTSRRFEIRIKKLCEEALKAQQNDVESVFQELQEALREQNELMRKLAAELAYRSPLPKADACRKRKEK